MKLLACFAIPLLAIAMIASAAVAAGTVTLCVDKGIGILAVLIVAVFIAAMVIGCRWLARLSDFVGSHDQPRINRRERRIAGCPIERA